MVAHLCRKRDDASENLLLGLEGCAGTAACIRAMSYITRRQLQAVTRNNRPQTRHLQPCKVSPTTQLTCFVNLF